MTCEVAFDALLARPAKADRITRKGLTWKPIDVVDRNDVQAWEVALERV